MPSVASIRRFEESAVGPAVLIRVFPRSLARLPHAGVEDVGIRRVDFDVASTSVLVLEENVLPGLSTVSRAEDATLLVRAIRMPQNRCIYPVGAFGIHAN